MPAILFMTFSSFPNMEKKEISLSFPRITARASGRGTCLRPGMGSLSPGLFMRFCPPPLDDNGLGVSGDHVIGQRIDNRQVVNKLFDLLKVVDQLGYVRRFLRILDRLLFPEEEIPRVFK